MELYICIITTNYLQYFHMDGRVVKAHALRACGAIRVGSNPTPCIFFLLFVYLK